MHYKNGRPAKVGDKIVVFGYDKTPYTVAILTSATSTSNSCNGNYVPLTQGSMCCTLGECLHVDDVFTAEAVPPYRQDAVAT